MTETISPDVTVDARGAACPGPLMDLIGAMKTAESGTLVELQSDNGQSTTDVPEWVEEAGHELIEVDERDDHWRIYVKKT